MHNLWPARQANQASSESGVALILVLMVVSLCTIIITQLTYTSTLDTRLHLISRRSLEAEYLLKSVVNFGRAILKADVSPEDTPQDSWAIFQQGLEVPKEVLKIRDPSVRLELEIRPEESKLPIQMLRGGDKRWRDVFVRFFERMEFDTDGATDGSGLFPGRVFTAREVVANLIDYMDRDDESYDEDDFPSGIESELPEGTFPNKSIKWLGELSAVPGMNADRLRRVSPFLTRSGVGKININFAPQIILESLHEEIGSAEVQAILQLRAEVSLDDQNKVAELTPIIGQDVMSQILSQTSVNSSWFQILAKVDYGASTSFMRAYVSQNNPGELPTIRISEIFS
ncbi:type II secretion system protein GspK [bacterium]|nr:type II secretion system protein GspK [bacterium]